MKLNLGCGQEILDDHVNCDLLDLPGVDVVHNLVFIPYPFKDNEFDTVLAKDLLEHIPNYSPDWKPMIPAFMEEMYRILKPGGQLRIQTPSYKAEFLHIDPTHVRGFHLDSLDFFDKETDFGKATGFYSKADFKILDKYEHENLNLTFILEKR